MYIDGSFVTAKETPNDYDACYEGAGVDPDALDPVLMDCTDHRRAQKDTFGGEWFVAEWPAEPGGTRFIEFFQRDRDGNPKGIVAIDLEAEQL